MRRDGGKKGSPMISKATVTGIAASGGIRPDSHITACPVTAIKAGPVAHHLAGVIEGTQRHCDVFARAMVSDLSPSYICPRGPLLETARTLHDQKRLVSPARRCGTADLTLTGQHTPNKNTVNSANGGTAADRSGKTICHALILVLGAERAGACRSRSIFFL